ncbi:uncharacterized protein LOC135830099 [Sycon ciliatum]|uniref:uncharacterized protein LOC135830099 n=1 Tax=Sycon ciliatum TaxID=27933 RepID=UPI0031F6F07C
MSSSSQELDEDQIVACEQAAMQALISTISDTIDASHMLMYFQQEKIIDPKEKEAIKRGHPTRDELNTRFLDLVCYQKFNLGNITAYQCFVRYCIKNRAYPKLKEKLCREFEKQKAPTDAPAPYVARVSSPSEGYEPDRVSITSNSTDASPFSRPGSSRLPNDSMSSWSAMSTPNSSGRQSATPATDFSPGQTSVTPVTPVQRTMPPVRAVDDGQGARKLIPEKVVFPPLADTLPSPPRAQPSAAVVGAAAGGSGGGSGNVPAALFTPSRAPHFNVQNLPSRQPTSTLSLSPSSSSSSMSMSTSRQGSLVAKESVSSSSASDGSDMYKSRSSPSSAQAVYRESPCGQPSYAERAFQPGTESVTPALDATAAWVRSTGNP